MNLTQRSQQSLATLGLAALMAFGAADGLASRSPIFQPVLANPAIAADIFSSGEFTNVAHTTNGSARIVMDGDARYLELSEDFGTDSGPDLFVLLHRSDVPENYDESDFSNLGMLEQVSGTQRYLIPEDVDIDDFQSAVIWCRQFNVTFGYAELN